MNGGEDKAAVALLPRTFQEIDMKKLMTLCLAALALALGTNNVLAASEAASAAKKSVAAKKKPVIAAKKKPAATPAVSGSMVVLEAMWTAGGQEYKDAVIAASARYKEVMDRSSCKTKVPFNVSDLAKAYRVYTPAGMEPVRDGWIRKQVGTMACITMNRDGEQIAEKNLL